MTTSEKISPELVTVPNSTRIAPTLASLIADARSYAAGEEYVPVVYCTDVLLDCWNAADRPSVQGVIGSLLPDFTNGNIRKRVDFVDALDQIEMALDTDAAFDEVRDS